MMPIHTILHPTDFSDSARYAFSVAAILAREHKARLVVLHVRQTLGPMVSFGDALARLETPGYQEKLWGLLRRFVVADSRVQVDHRMVEGDAVKQILRTAEHTHCDLIVMGTHGRTGLDRLVLGSVADRVLRGARCGVMTVRAPQPAEHEEAVAADGESAEELSAMPL